jgi:hypothetical protein
MDMAGAAQPSAHAHKMRNFINGSSSVAIFARAYYASAANTHDTQAYQAYQSFGDWGRLGGG